MGLKIHSVARRCFYTSSVRITIRLPLFALGCAALLLAAACSSSSDKLAPSTGGEASLPASEQTLPAGHPTVDPGAAELPVDALLAEADLGSDWAQGTHEDDPLAPIDSYYCGKKVASLPWTHVAQFANEKSGAMMIQILSKFSDEAAAQTAVKEQRDATAGCAAWSSGAGAGKIDWRIESTKALDFGDEGFAELSSTQAGDPPQRAVDFVVLVRKGAVVILIDEAGGGDMDGSEAIAVARKALDKLEAAVKAP